jgi:hypothetical protein
LDSQRVMYASRAFLMNFLPLLPSSPSILSLSLIKFNTTRRKKKKLPGKQQAPRIAATGAGESRQRDLAVEVSANAAIPHRLHHIRLWGAKARGPCRRHMTDWTTTTTSRNRIALLFSQPTSLKKPQRLGKAETSTHC